jgi:hypothetical protein
MVWMDLTCRVARKESIEPQLSLDVVATTMALNHQELSAVEAWSGVPQ